MRKRFIKLGLLLGALLFFGGLYAFVGSLTGFLIPCPFRTLTGLQCPGCGVTHMLLALLRFDFAEAWHANPVLLCLLPVIIFFIVLTMVKYVRTGGTMPGRIQNGIITGMIVILVVFGIVRNLPL